MTENKNISRLKGWYQEGRVSRRDFLRQSTLLGLSSVAAYSFAGLTAPELARAQDGAKPKGGTLRMGMRVLDITNPHAIGFNEGATTLRPTCDFLVRTGADNITRPWLLSGWDVSDDLRSWTLRVRDGVNWHSGRAVTGEDVAWNIRHVLAPGTGSSVVGLMGSYMLEEVETGEKDDEGNPVTVSELWDSNAVELVDPMTVRLNLKQPQGAVPEHLFHFPFFIIDPEENGSFGVGSNGTGAYRLVEYQIGERAVHERIEGTHFMGEGPHLDRIVVTDLGEDPNAVVGALMADQADMLYEISENQVPVVADAPQIKVYRATTGATAVTRGRMDQPPFDDPRVMKAMRLATNSENVITRALRDNATEGDHTHVSPIHPEWVDLGDYTYDPEQARALLAEAGYPDGLEIEYNVKTQPAWELQVAQVLVEDWSKAGINATIQTLPASVFWDNWTTYPFSLTAWGHRPLGMMVLSLAYRTGAPWNESGFSHSEFDRLLDDIEGTVDPDERKEIMGKLMTIMREEGPLVQPFLMDVANAVNERVKGFEQHPSKYIFFEPLAVET